VGSLVVDDLLQGMNEWRNIQVKKKGKKKSFSKGIDRMAQHARKALLRLY
jgi:hypothetical protein